MITRKLSGLGATFALAAILFSAPPARADDWPNRPVKIVIPFGAGGTSDRFGRLAAAELSKALKQQFYVENKPGAAGVTASAEVARSQPCGHGTEYHGARHQPPCWLRPDQ